MSRAGESEGGQAACGAGTSSPQIRDTPRPGRVERVQARRERACSEPSIGRTICAKLETSFSIAGETTTRRPRASSGHARAVRRAGPSLAGSPPAAPHTLALRPFQEERLAGQAHGRCARSRRTRMIARRPPSYKIRNTMLLHAAIGAPRAPVGLPSVRALRPAPTRRTYPRRSRRTSRRSGTPLDRTRRPRTSRPGTTERRRRTGGRRDRARAGASSCSS